MKDEIISFADDTTIFFTADTWIEVQDIVSSELQIIKKWFDLNFHTMNIGKTTYLPFTSYQNNLPDFEDIKIKNTTFKIRSSISVKYLGVILDSHLRWNLHINETARKLRFVLYRFRKLKNILTNKELSIIYYGLSESLFQYGILAWGGASKVHINPLIMIQKRFLKIILKKIRF